ncbi:MAG: hypothetical protein K9H65_03570 [Bacteroidales bacterium]|nr:hypothetical protein [Bacteroidales bacterium]
MRLIVLLLIFSVIPFTAIAQNLPEGYNSYPLHSKDTHSVFLSIDNTNFFKNNEYYNDYVAGYSKTGFFFNPTLSWVVSDKTRLGGGVHLLKYAGEHGFNKVKPVFYLRHQLFDGLELMMGSIKSTHHHNLIDPLYHYERFLDKHIENGLQFLIDKPFVQADIWVNWKNFISRGDDSREIFDMGISSGLPLYGKQQDFTVQFPLQVIFQHKGGQIDNSGKPVNTFSNFAGGPALQLKLHSRYLTSLEWENLYVGYRDLSPGNKREIEKGHAWMSTFSLNMKKLQFQFSWWKSRRFLSFAGNPMYQTFSIRKERLINDKRELLIGKLRYSKKYKDLYFMFNFDTYLSPRTHQLDYGFGIYLLLNTDVFLTQLGK